MRTFLGVLVILMGIAFIAVGLWQLGMPILYIGTGLILASVGGGILDRR